MRVRAISGESKIVPREVSRWRNMLLVLVAFSFFCLSYASQTHIHGQPSTVPVSAISKILHLDRATNTSHTPDNGDSDGAACPLCQAVAIGGAILVPLLLVFLTLFRMAEDGPSFVVQRSLFAFQRQGHQTRGPPTL